MEFYEYQQRAYDTAIYPQRGDGTDVAINYAILGLVGESGEIPNKWKKHYRDNRPITDVRNDIADELGDCLWYVANLANELGFTLDDIAKRNLDKLQSRQERGVIGGSGDYR